MTAQTASPETTPAMVLTVAFFAFTTTNTPSSINGTTVTSSSSQEGSGQN
ncbi:MAG: hypothetical protein HYR89_00180 [Actinobacteria bacterium]|nr:hypothetical protein [Actinomycetota bacterium]